MNALAMVALAYICGRALCIHATNLDNGPEKLGLLELVIVIGLALVCVTSALLAIWLV